ncbi:MAG: TGS domain-containing protein [Candidatus Bathyarchaeota archaeon]|nr:MAG: TGS domain-containing protein [Candidatus Bathyarchaeota archaeon]
MPTNLPAEAKKKWDEASSTRNPKQKLQLLQEFLSLVPKHKGTEKLRAQVKTKMATLRREIEEKSHRKVGARGPSFFIEKEGAAQIVILGQTKVGRSSLLTSVTHAKVEVSHYPFTTLEPVPGMLPFEDIQIQMIEAPALFDGAAEGKAWGQQALALARNADGLVLMVALDENPGEQLAIISSELEKARILVRKPSARVEIERKHMGVGLRIVVIGNLIDCTLKDVENLLKSYRISNAVVKIHGDAKLDDVEDSIFESAVFRPAIIVANKFDIKGAAASLSRLKRLVSGQFSVIPVSCRTGFGLKKLGTELFKSLEIIRIYTKEPSTREPSASPFILKKGSTVEELAKQIHSDFFKYFSYARVWSKHLKFSPQKVGLSFALRDKDVVEIHVR